MRLTSTMLNAEALTQLRTLLYVPGHRPERFRKAVESGADAIVLDLEDSVAPGSKYLARENVRRWLAGGGTGIVRINGPSTPWYDDDISMVAVCGSPVILPKSSSASQVEDVRGVLGSRSCLIPILETASGILSAYEICSVFGVVRVIFGGGDLSRELGTDHTDHGSLQCARSQVVLASAAAEIAAPVDGVTSSLRDETKLIDDVRRAVSLGFRAKSCVHPRQVPVVHAALEPSHEQISWARDVLRVAGDGSATSLDGEIIGKPVIDRARALLARVDAEHGATLEI